MSMQKIRKTSRKYDGRLRDAYEAWLYAEDDERLVVYAPVGTLSYDRRTQAWVAAPDGLLEIYFKTRWYNVWHICEQTSEQIRAIFASRLQVRSVMERFGYPAFSSRLRMS
jgi:protein associated with RNAse G/E